ncbi:MULTISPECIES: metal ABC transporter solute-binding protein, Zn/Mn family [unclassified Streptomyces]|uniref:metal ABC transporter solute-binding protein, Zn/Mn family n=1 Tax=unclassified Streptomyces TaxID=2593676 RepID=UPI002251FD68|nr:MULTISPECIES: zinc ABC transporter substrate-binding protein [unclassified Streptomyces]MCX5151073.1 ABC transporter substrate-binding protein [Streptomyces sp. NBC_00320]WSN47377.1 ABC transporter substrate-binding protein [Streptomyces sp. NBC_01296]
MARTRVRFSSLLALSAALALVTGCGNGNGNGNGDTASKDGPPGHHGGKPVVVVTTTWEGAFAKAAGAEDVKVIVPQSVHHAPDYDPKPSDLAAVGKADFVLYAPFEPYAAKIKEAAGSKAELVEVNLDNDADKVRAEVARLGKLFGTEEAATKWSASFDTEYAKLSKDVEGSWPGGKSPAVVSQVFTTWSAKLAGATAVGTYGPEAVTPAQLAELSGKKPALVLDNAHMSTGTVLPDSGARQVEIVNYPGADLDLLPVYRNAAAELKKAMGGS